MGQLVVKLHGQVESEISLDPSQEYIAGRSSNCQIKLNEVVGISRQHFKIYFDGTTWRVELLAKFGELQVAGERTPEFELNEEVSFSVPPYEFSLVQEKNKNSNSQEESIDSENLPAVTNNFAPSQPDTANALTTQDNEDEFENTFVDNVQLVPYITVQSSSGKQKNLRLEGNSWIAGRDKSCSIPIKDNRISRQQFEIFLAENRFFIKDLKSANGTQLNGVTLEPGKAHELKSGDIIGALSNVLIFELKNIMFENQLVEANNVMAPVPPMQSVSTDFQDPYSNQSIAPYPPQQNYHQETSNKKSKTQSVSNKRVFYIRLVSGLVIAFGAYLYLNPQSQTTTQSSQVKEAATPFEALSKKDQTFVRQTYELGKNFYMQGKYELGLAEIKKIHAMIPEYESSIEIEESCIRAIEINKNKKALEEQERKKKELEVQVQSIIKKCKKIFSPSITMDKFNNCISPAVEIDPENEEIQKMRGEIEAFQESSRIANIQKVEYQSQVRRLETLFQSANKVNPSSDPFGAIRKLQSVVNSRLPDPKGRKKEAKRKIASTRSLISNKTKQYMSEADQLAASKNFKEAISVLRKARKFNPSDRSIKSTINDYKNQISKKVRPLYQEAILEENMGNINVAKNKWKEIMDLDVRDGEYSKKSKKKLKQYGGP